MSQQEDLLFCKIAIQSGLVTEEGARKCLAYSQKMEAAGKPRPRIGGVFVTANLLSRHDTTRVYQAVQKRAGSRSVAAAEKKPRGGRRARAARHEPEPRRARRAPRPQMDPRMMWLGIGSAVVLLGAVMVMTIMVMNAGKAENERTLAASSSSNPTTAESFRKTLLGAGGSAAPVAPRRESLEGRDAFEARHRQVIFDAVAFRRDELLYRAYQHLSKFRESEKVNYSFFADLAGRIDADIAGIEAQMKVAADEALADAKSLAAEGKKAEATDRVEYVKEKVDPQSRKLLEEKLRKILDPGQE